MFKYILLLANLILGILLNTLFCYYINATDIIKDSAKEKLSLPFEFDNMRQDIYKSQTKTIDSKAKQISPKTLPAVYKDHITQKQKNIINSLPDINNVTKEESMIKKAPNNNSLSNLPSKPSSNSQSKLITNNQPNLNKSSPTLVTTKEKISKDIDYQKKQNFINNEVKRLYNNKLNQDVKNGKITKQEKIANMDFDRYVKLFWLLYHDSKSLPKRVAINSFIKHYDKNHKYYPVNIENQNFIDLNKIFNEAAKCIYENEFTKLQELINMDYDVINLSDHQNNNLLHIAAYTNNINVAKLLILKGININQKNDLGDTAHDIATKYGFYNMIQIINQ